MPPVAAHNLRLSLLQNMLLMGILLLFGLHSLALGLTSYFDHDENQFIASGYLLAREGLLPYWDYPYFHLPILSGVYAILFLFTNEFLLSIRIFTAVCAWGIAAMLFFESFKLFPQQPFWVRILGSTGIVALLVTNSILLYTAGKGWNHSFPLLLSLLALQVAIQTANNSSHSVRRLFWSGLLISLATGARISFAPLAFPLLVGILFLPKRDWVNRIQGIAYYLLGGFVAALPVLVLFVGAPEAFWFDTVQYHTQIDKAYFAGTAIELSLSERWAHLWKNFTTGRNVLLTGSFLFFTLAGIVVASLKRRISYGFALVLGLLPFLLFGILSKTIIFYQYFFAPLPFMCLAILYGIQSVSKKYFQCAGSLSLIVLAMVQIWLKPEEALVISNLNQPERWTHKVQHIVSEGLAQLPDSSKVLTLAPFHALEEGKKIYPAFATGPFAWRTAEFMLEEKREVAGVIGPKELGNYLQSQPPDAIFLGFENPKHEQPLLEYAQSYGYQEYLVPDDGVLLLLSYASQKDTMQLFDFEYSTLTTISLDTVFAGKQAYRLTTEYSPGIKLPIAEIAKTLPVDFQLSVQVFPTVVLAKHQLLLVLTITDADEQTKDTWLGYHVEASEAPPGEWTEVQVRYRFNRPLKGGEQVSALLWYHRNEPVYLDNFMLEVGFP